MKIQPNNLLEKHEITKSFTYILFIYSLFTACTERSILKDSEIKHIHSFPRTQTITGEKLDIELLGVSTFFLVDSFLITKNHNMDHYLTVYSLNNLNKIQSFIPRGRGENEFLDFTYCDYYRKDSNQIYLYFTDINQRILLKFDLTQSIMQEKTITALLATSRSVYFKTKYENDTSIYSRTYDPINKNLSYIKHNLQDSILDRFVLYENVDDLLRNKVGSADKMKADFTKLAQAMIQFDQINIVDFKNRKNLSLTTSSHFMQPTNNDNQEPIMYYSDLTCSNEYIFALYPRQPITQWGLQEKKSEIQVFTWDGEAVCKIFTPDYLLYIQVDKENKFLYGLNANEEIILYPLPKI